MIPLPSLIPPLAYAETHYRFPFFGSLLFKAEPEIIFDLPHRISPGHAIPLLLLVKDADRFPSELLDIRVDILDNRGRTRTIDILKEPLVLKEKIHWQVFSLSRDDCSEWLQVDVQFTVSTPRGTRIYRNDNHQTSSKKPLRVYVSWTALPKFDRWHLGEGHSHSDRTDDQVEFGIPLGAARVMCEPLGLSFACVTDHSYDLDDDPENYLQNHPDVPKWHSLQAEIDRINAGDGKFAFVRGEEVSCRTSLGRNVHLLLLGNRSFFPGSGDSAERWLRTRSELAAQDILANREPGVAAFAAHPLESVPWIQRLLLGRGEWESDDLADAGLDGMQVANGKADEGFAAGVRQWIKLLLSGQRKTIFGGDDAHGNFNRFRQIGIPFLKIRESEEQLFGLNRTAVRSDVLTEEAVVNAIRTGKSVITDGPVLDIRVGGESVVGEILTKGLIEVELHSLTTSEYGSFRSILLFHGEIGGIERVVATTEDVGGVLRARLIFEHRGYLRAEAWTKEKESAYGRSHYCFTNPVWLMP